jgi:hypothetical protein
VTQEIPRLVWGSALNRLVDHFENIPPRNRGYGAAFPSLAELPLEFLRHCVSTPLPRQNAFDVQICHYVEGVGILAQLSEA